MDDRYRYFDRPTREETTEAKRARKRRKEQDEYEARVRASHEARRREIDEAAKDEPKGMWWPGS